MTNIYNSHTDCAARMNGSKGGTLREFSSSADVIIDMTPGTPSSGLALTTGRDKLNEVKDIANGDSEGDTITTETNEDADGSLETHQHHLEAVRQLSKWSVVKRKLNDRVEERSKISTDLIGKALDLNHDLKKRLYWGQRLTVIFSAVSELLYVLNYAVFEGTSVSLNIAVCITTPAIFCSTFVVFYKNTSYQIIRKLLAQPDTLVLIFVAFAIFIIDCWVPENGYTPFFGFIYFLCVCVFILIDAIELKRRYFVLLFGSLYFTALTLWNIIDLYFVNPGTTVLFTYENVPVYKAHAQRTLFLQIFLSGLNALITIYSDKNMELMYFGLGHLFRETGHHHREYHVISKTHLHAHHGDEKMRRASTVLVLGKLHSIDRAFATRLARSQKVIPVCGLICIVLYCVDDFALGGGNNVIRVLTLVAFSVGSIALFTVFYKNISKTILKKLLKQPDVACMVFFALGIFVIDCYRPYSPSSPFFGLMYFVAVLLFILGDAVRIKERGFMIGFGAVFCLLNIYNLYSQMFYEQETILFTYGDYTLYKANVKISCFTNIFLFSCSGIVTVVKDKNMRLLAFATGNLYKKTGTTSNEKRDFKYAASRKKEVISFIIKSDMGHSTLRRAFSSSTDRSPELVEITTTKQVTV